MVDRDSWYEQAADYYETNCEPTVDGVLGGFGEVSDCDITESKKFIQHIQEIRPSFRPEDGAACECGAGIGRVTKELLLSLHTQRCDLVESSPKLIAQAPDYIGSRSSKCRFFCQSLQDWEPPHLSYSIIWIQWVLIYLRDEDLIEFLKRCAAALVPGGVIILKENCITGKDFTVDLDDASLTRSIRYWKYLIQEAGLVVVLQETQTNFPDELELFPVEMFALALPQ